MGVEHMKFTVGKGMEEYLQQLGNLERTVPKAIGFAIYDGASVVYKAIKSNISNLPTGKDLTQEQKDGLMSSFGTAKARTDYGYRNVKVGFHGYNNVKSKKYPGGQPNAMIAASVEGGTSFSKKHPFVAPAVRASKGPAEEAMRRTLDAEILKAMN